ncbi:hypothetical protein [Vulcanisaeta sp. JCM 16161]|nr:hypothetical protein [Vulcanisaeta sp. JCM 16161]
MSWTYIPALSVSNYMPVPNGFLLTCTLNSYNYVFLGKYSDYGDSKYPR